MFAEAIWEHGDPQEAWVKLLTRVMEDAVRRPERWENQGIRAEGQTDFEARCRRLERNIANSQAAYGSALNQGRGPHQENTC